jgi:hypothetical protein
MPIEPIMICFASSFIIVFAKRRLCDGKKNAYNRAPQ